MPYNGSGTYSLPAGNPVVTGSTISSTTHNNTNTDIASALSNCITRDGQSAPTANIPMGGFKHTGLAAGTGNGESVRYEQVGDLAIAQTHAAATKATPVDADEIPLSDSAAAFALKKLTWANLKTTLASTFAALAGATFTGGINEARGSVVMNATTMNLWALPNVIDGTGSPVTITAIVNAPQAGSRRTLYPIAGTIITQGATFSVQGGASYTTATGDALVFEAVTVSTYKVEIIKADGIAIYPSPQIRSISASVAASALTISASALSLDFRSTTLGSGTITRVNGTPANLVISSGSTLGTVNAVQSRIVVLALNNAGAIELAAVNLAGGVNLDESGLISTTAEGGAGAADSATVVYSTTARTNVAYRVIGYIESTQATAGTWATAPSTIQGQGGQALSVMSSIGYGQTWQTVVRAAATTYYNTTGKPILWAIGNGASSNATPTINGFTFQGIVTPAACAVETTFIIPPNGSYSYTTTAGAIVHAELR